jgi:hypothetical protein
MVLPLVSYHPPPPCPGAATRRESFVGSIRIMIILERSINDDCRYYHSSWWLVVVPCRCRRGCRLLLLVRSPSPESATNTATLLLLRIDRIGGNMIESKEGACGYDDFDARERPSDNSYHRDLSRVPQLAVVAGRRRQRPIAALPPIFAVTPGIGSVTILSTNAVSHIVKSPCGTLRINLRPL